MESTGISHKISRLLLAAVLAVAVPCAYAELRIGFGSGERIESFVGAVVTLDGSALDAEPRSAPVVMEQVGRQFRPFILPVPAGVPVSFPNRDGIAHHVYSFSRAKTFEIPLYRGVTPDPVVFDNPGVVPLGCNIHDWMLGYLVVLEAPRFAQLAAGDVHFEDVPPGTYQVSFWHPALGSGPWPSWEIEVSAEGQHIELALPDPVLVADQPTPPRERIDENPDY